MQASSLTSRFRRGMVIRDWAWWQIPPLLRWYVAGVVAVAVAGMGVGIALTNWHANDLVEFLLLACCGTISMASTPRIMYSYSGVTRDFSSIWVLPTAILLPPVYSMIIAIPIMAALQLFVHHGLLYRRVFSAASHGLAYASISLVFRAFPHSFAGPTPGTGLHAFTWCLAVGACEILGCRIQHFLIVAAVKMANPATRFFAGEFERDALQGLFVEIDLGVLITVAVALSPVLMAIALPTVLLVRRFLIHPVLVAQSRTDSKTGLLNVSTWESEAEVELSRATRTRNPVALALVDIDHFKVVNDTYGHLVGDRVLKAIAEALTGQSRDYDRAGRFGGEEFVLLLAQTKEEDACRIAERLRDYIHNLAIPTADRPDAPTVSVTISVGVTAMARGESFELTDLLAAADSAMYAAKQAGRNRVAFAPPLHDMGIDAAWDAQQGTADPSAGASPEGAQPAGSTAFSSHRVVLVQTDQAAASLCQKRLLSVLISAHPAAAIASALTAARAPPPGALAARWGGHRLVSTEADVSSGVSNVASEGTQAMTTITPCLWFDGNGLAAAEHYVSVIPDSRITDVSYYGEDQPGQPGTVMTVAFELAGRPFTALNGGPEYKFTEAVSMQVSARDQAEVDRYTERLTEGGGEVGPCGWVKDRFGLSWQVVPEELVKLIGDPNPLRANAAVQAMLGMTKIDIQALRDAADAAAAA